MFWLAEATNTSAVGVSAPITRNVACTGEDYTMHSATFQCHHNASRNVCFLTKVLCTARKFRIFSHLSVNVAVLSRQFQSCLVCIGLSMCILIFPLILWTLISKIYPFTSCHCGLCNSAHIAALCQCSHKHNAGLPFTQSCKCPSKSHKKPWPCQSTCFLAWC